MSNETFSYITYKEKILYSLSYCVMIKTLTDRWTDDVITIGLSYFMRGSKNGQQQTTMTIIL